jgi:hypothetical protein
LGQPLGERRVGYSPGITADGLLVLGIGRLGIGPEGQGCEAGEEENWKQAHTMQFHKTSVLVESPPGAPGALADAGRNAVETASSLQKDP